MPEPVNNTRNIDPRTLKVPTRLPAQTEPGKPSLEPESAAGRTDGPRKPAKSNPFRRYSLLGKADEIEASAAEAKPLLGKFVLRGQATMIYAEPNTGKTLITLKLCLDAIERGKIDPDHLYYINADDSSHGLAAKAKLLEEAGAHMLAPGWRGFRTGQLVELLVQAVEDRRAIPGVRVYRPGPTDPAEPTRQQSGPAASRAEPTAGKIRGHRRPRRRHTFCART
ncbi:AAA family ATPase [Caulobacter radicis]